MFIVWLHRKDPYFLPNPPPNHALGLIMWIDLRLCKINMKRVVLVYQAIMWLKNALSWAAFWLYFIKHESTKEPRYHWLNDYIHLLIKQNTWILIPFNVKLISEKRIRYNPFLYIYLLYYLLFHYLQIKVFAQLLIRSL